MLIARLSKDLELSGFCVLKTLDISKDKVNRFKDVLWLV